MNKDTSELFKRVARKMGWSDDDGLDASEKLVTTIGKSRHAATSVPPVYGVPSQLDQDDDQDKENQFSGRNVYRDKAVNDSSDDDFDQFLTGKATPKAKAPTTKPCSAVKNNGPAIHVVSSDDDGFEKFLQSVKTPNSKPKNTESGSDDSLKNFIVDYVSSDDDFIMPKSSTKVPKKTKTPSSQPTFRKPLSQCDSPVFVSESDDDDAIVVKSTWRTRDSKPKCPTQTTKNKIPLLDKTDDEMLSSPLLPPASYFAFPTNNTPDVEGSSRRPLSAPTTLNDSASSEEEFSSLLERLKKKKAVAPPCTPKISKAPPPKALTTPTLLPKSTLDIKTHGKSTFVRPTVSQSEPRNPSSSRLACKTPGCFLQALSNPGSCYERNFKQKKEDLTARLYQLYNTSVFDSKLPADMSVTWNKKMRKTAGYCISGQERGGGKRYARIELSEKVCDSVDRLRDTLIHEMCHAATWLINGVRDGHGNFWKFYARKSTVAHPELPMVTRCHSYDIKYKFQYQCVRCQNTIGRHSKSLDTQRFVCAVCTGQLVLLTPSKPRAPTPFANFVKENYGTTRRGMAGQSHAEVMRKLSADFATKTKLSQS